MAGDGVWANIRAFLPRGSLPAVAARAGSAGLAFLATVVWARALGPHEYGAYALAIAFLAAGAVLAGLGLDVLTSRELAVLVHAEDWPHFWGYVRWSTFITAGASLGAGAIGAVILVLDPMGWEVDTRRAALWILLGLPAMMVLRLARGMFQAADQTAKGLFWELTFCNGLLVVVGLVTWVLIDEPTAREAAWAHAGTIAAAAAAALVSFHLLAWPRATPSTQKHGHWMQAGLGFAFLAAFALLLQQADVMLLGAIGTNAEAGIYSVASRCAALALMVLGPVQQVLGPRMAQAWSRGDTARAAAIARRAAQLSIVAGAGLLAFYLLFGRQFLGLFGPGYADASAALRILALAQVALLVFGPGQMVLSMTGGERGAGIVLLLALVLTLPASYMLYRWDGVDGMAWGRVVALTIVGAATGIMGRRRLSHRIDPWQRA